MVVVKWCAHSHMLGTSLHCTPPTNAPTLQMQDYHPSVTPSCALQLCSFPRLTAAEVIQKRGVILWHKGIMSRCITERGGWEVRKISNVCDTIYEWSILLAKNKIVSCMQCFKAIGIWHSKLLVKILPYGCVMRGGVGCIYWIAIVWSTVSCFRFKLEKQKYMTM